MIVEIPTFDSLIESVEGLVENFKKKATGKSDTKNTNLLGRKDIRNNGWIADRRPLFDCGCQFDEEDEEVDDKVFGAGFEIDEPRCEDYDSRWEFEDDHAAFDRFVEAGEDCVARGLEKTSPAPITKVNAFRKRVGELPPIGVALIGETHWWECL